MLTGLAFVSIALNFGDQPNFRRSARKVIPNKEILEYFLFCMYLGSFALSLPLLKAKWQNIVGSKKFFNSKYVQCNLDLVTLFIIVKKFTKSHGVTKSIGLDTHICPVCSFNFEFALMSRQLDSGYFEYFSYTLQFRGVGMSF